MPITFIIDPDTQIIYTTAFGDIHPDDLIAHGQRLADANLLNRPQVFDARAANLELTKAQVQRLATQTKEFRKGLKPTPVAFVTDSNSLYGMLRIYQVMIQNINPGFSVFRNIDEAQQWVRL